MTNRKITIIAYSVILTLLASILIIFSFVKDQERLKFFFTFLTLNGVLTSYLLVREYLEIKSNVSKTNLKMFILKVTLSVLFLILGSVLFFILSASLIRYINFIGLVFLLYVLNKKKNN